MENSLSSLSMAIQGAYLQKNNIRINLLNFAEKNHRYVKKHQKAGEVNMTLIWTRYFNEGLLYLCVPSLLWVGQERFSKRGYVYSPLSIRVQCCGSMPFWCGSGSMPLTNGSGFGSRSCYFRHWFSRVRLKTDLKKWFFCLLLFEAFFNDKKS